MSTFTWGLALILAGIIFLALGLVNLYYDKFVFRGYEEYDAVITKLRSMQGKSWSPYVSVVPYAEYSVNGRLVEGSYYTPVIKSIVKVREGDSVTVQVSPKKPKTFRMQAIESTTEMQNVHKRAPIITAVGAALLAGGIILLVI